MQNSRRKRLTILYCVLAGAFAAPAACSPPHTLVEPESQVWLKATLEPDKTRQFYVGTVFTSIKGKYPILSGDGPDYETMEGEFLVGQVRLTYYQPYDAGDGVTVDERIVTAVLDCKKQYYGTIKQVTKYRGKITSEEITPDAKMFMIELSGITTPGKKLCDLHSRGTPKQKTPSAVK